MRALEASAFKTRSEKLGAFEMRVLQRDVCQVDVMEVEAFRFSLPPSTSSNHRHSGLNVHVWTQQVCSNNQRWLGGCLFFRPKGLRDRPPSSPLAAAGTESVWTWSRARITCVA